MNPEIAPLLEKHYPQGPDSMELYPGLIVEEAKSEGIGLPYSISRGILADAVNLLRNDRYLADELTPRNLTSWGWQYANGDAEHHGSVFGKMIKAVFPTFAQTVGPTADAMLQNPFITL
jgi:hypothetical protein